MSDSSQSLPSRDLILLNTVAVVMTPKAKRRDLCNDQSAQPTRHHQRRWFCPKRTLMQSREMQGMNRRSQESKVVCMSWSPSTEADDSSLFCENGICIHFFVSGFSCMSKFVQFLLLFIWKSVTTVVLFTLEKNVCLPSFSEQCSQSQS
jgi:hypothetical protein